MSTVLSLPNESYALLAQERPEAVDAEKRFDPDWKHSKEAEAIWKREDDRVAQSLKQAPAAAVWAGEYRMGDGRGKNVKLRVAPGAGFSYEWHGCVGVYDRNWGDVAVEGDGTLKLTCKWPNTGAWFGIPTSLVSVTWADRRYLLVPDEVAEFVFRIERGFEPRQDVLGMDLLRDGDETKPAPGLPELPAAFREYLPKAAIEATVIEVKPLRLRSNGSGSPDKVIPIVVDKGDDDGVLPGMVFITDRERGIDCPLCLVVEEVQAHAATCVLTDGWSTIAPITVDIIPGDKARIGARLPRAD